MAIPIFEQKQILLGVTGSIACYKAADLASRLRQAGARVTVILTEAAAHFITPLTFQSLTGERVYLDEDLWGTEGHIVHIRLAETADLLVIAPCTADTLARLAHGRADNLLSLTALAARCPLLVAPAMDGGMWKSPATQANVQSLTDRGVTILGPASGHLASGLSGAGRMLEPGDLFGHLRLALAAGGPLQSRKVIVTAGGTQEPIDPVRSINNRSSGKQGFALAQAALDLGAEVILISAPVHLAPPAGSRLISVRTAEEMRTAVLDALPGSFALLMAAAVADFTPQAPASGKLKKRDGIPRIDLKEAPDILEEVARYKTEHGYPQRTVGFAAESSDLIANAREKLTAKNMDLMVANDITAPGAGFAVDTNRVTLLHPDGRVEELPLVSKDEVARRVLEILLNASALEEK